MKEKKKKPKEKDNFNKNHVSASEVIDNVLTPPVCHEDSDPVSERIEGNILNLARRDLEETVRRHVSVVGYIDPGEIGHFLNLPQEVAEEICKNAFFIYNWEVEKERWGWTD